MSNKKTPVDWRTVNLKDFSNVVFKDSPNMSSAASAVVKNSAGRFLEFVSPKMRCFGISYKDYDGKLSFSVSHAFDGDNDTDEVKAYRKFLEDLHTHVLQFCTDGKKPDPFVQFPKVKDANNPSSDPMKPNYLKVGKEFVRDMERNPTVRYKIYPERKNGIETDNIDVKLYNKKEQPLFHYGDKDSDEYFRDKEIPERSFKAEMEAIEKGCFIRVFCTARLSTTHDGSIYYSALTATQIKRIAAGAAGPAVDAKVSFGNDDEDEDEDAGGGGVVVVAAESKKRPRYDDDGIDDELLLLLQETKAEEASAAAASVEEEEEEAEPAAVVVVVAPPPLKKKRALVVPK